MRIPGRAICEELVRVCRVCVCVSRAPSGARPCSVRSRRCGLGRGGAGESGSGHGCGGAWLAAELGARCPCTRLTSKRLTSKRYPPTITNAR